MASRIISEKPISKTLIRNWIILKRAWSMNLTAFSNTISNLSNKDALELYDIARLAPYKQTYVDILRIRPELKVILKNDLERRMMMDIYDNLSYRLNKKEPEPASVKFIIEMKKRLPLRRGFWY